MILENQCPSTFQNKFTLELYMRDTELKSDFPERMPFLA